MNIYNNGLNIHYHMYQARPDFPWLVMLHGFMGSGAVFNHLTNLLNEYCNPVTVDLAGHGKSVRCTSAHRLSLEQQLDDIDTIIRALPAKNIVLYGYSMGGRLALQYACRYTDHITGLILESTHAGIGDPGLRKERRIKDEERITKIEQNFTNFLEIWQQIPLLQPSAGTSKRLIKKYRQIQENQLPHQMALSLKGFGAGIMPDCRHMARHIPIPALLLAGERDEKYIALQSQLHHLIPESYLTIVPEAGHRIHLDQPEQLTLEIEQFLQQSEL